MKWKVVLAKTSMQIITVTKDSPKQIVITKPEQYQIDLVDPGVELEISGRFLVKNKDQANLEVIIHHMAPHTKAKTNFKGVVDDQGFLRILGRIIIDQSCPDTNSFLEERIILLSDQARAEAIPDLEILSDDVKCSHAAAISHLNKDQLFYLQSRGLNYKQAQQMIVAGFLET